MVVSTFFPKKTVGFCHFKIRTYITLYRVTKGTAGTPIQDPIVNDKLSALGVGALFSSANARAAKAWPSKWSHMPFFWQTSENLDGLKL